ncbi:Vitamin B12 ABC transporter, B12-binding component BtuF (plasmid) [Euzebya pacifica]|uniref:Vitamin B12 ABC transporter, B12-binding component BtuF n=1 Tax=Euzebya pacifica TaxID=1608957 RepID=A0A346Y719_9ACTN|nr:Vitamin B12 ABC transporter, B12-binding component BtuF [Euzebya pacifica]
MPHPVLSDATRRTQRRAIAGVALATAIALAAPAGDPSPSGATVAQATEHVGPTAGAPSGQPRFPVVPDGIALPGSPDLLADLIGSRDPVDDVPFTSLLVGPDATPLPAAHLPEPGPSVTIAQAGTPTGVAAATRPAIGTPPLDVRPGETAPLEQQDTATSGPAAGDREPTPAGPQPGGAPAEPATDPDPADPGPADPGPADPGPADPGPADPGPADPEPTPTPSAGPVAEVVEALPEPAPSVAEPAAPVIEAIDDVVAAVVDLLPPPPPPSAPAPPPVVPAPPVESVLSAVPAPPPPPASTPVTPVPPVPSIGG